jgi:uncharacterized membrane protein YdjX (TVP38/TMEM64 family)
MSRRRLLLATLILGVAAAFFIFDLGQYFQIEFLRSKQAWLEEFRRSNPLALGAIFFLIYVTVCAVSLPGAAVMSLVVGAIFGLAWGTLIVSFASSIGATLAFLSSRFLFREWVRSRFGNRLRTLDAGLEKEGAFYLFALRIVPAVPYVVVNLLMGLPPVRPDVLLNRSAYFRVRWSIQRGPACDPRDQGLFSPERSALLVLRIFPFSPRRSSAGSKPSTPKSDPRRFDRNAGDRQLRRHSGGVHRGGVVKVTRSKSTAWRGLPQHGLRTSRPSSNRRASSPRRNAPGVQPVDAGRVRFRRGHGAGAARGEGRRAARFGPRYAALGVECLQAGEDHLPGQWRRNRTRCAH